MQTLKVRCRSTSTVTSKHPNMHRPKKKWKKKGKESADVASTPANKRPNQTPQRFETQAALKEDKVNHAIPNSSLVPKEDDTGEAGHDSPFADGTLKSLPKKDRETKTASEDRKIHTSQKTSKKEHSPPRQRNTKKPKVKLSYRQKPVSELTYL